MFNDTNLPYKSKCKESISVAFKSKNVIVIITKVLT